MAYTKTVWVNNDAPYLNATNLNKIEDGIFNLDASKQDKNNPIFTATVYAPAANIQGSIIVASEQYEFNEDGTDLILTHRNPVNSVLRVKADANELVLNTNDLFYGNVRVLLDGDLDLSTKADITYVDSENAAQDVEIATKAEQTDFLDHTNSTTNPHSTTALQVGALPVNSPAFTGILSGGLSNIDTMILDSKYQYRTGIDYGEVVDGTGDTTYHRFYDDSQELIQTSTFLTWGSKNVVVEDAYATDTVGGTIKVAVIGTDCYITTDGSTPGA